MTDPNEVRNPRYAGATLGDMVRALMRPKPKPPAPEKGREKTIELDGNRVMFQRKRDGSPDPD